MDEQASRAMERWFELCHRTRVGLTAASEMGNVLVEAYGQPQRHYHTLDHISACLRLAADAPLAPEDRVVVEFALWFHDVVYDPRRSDNEEMSARLAAAWMDEAGVDGASRVGDLIRMTAGHDIDEAADLAAKVVHDVDLSVLGSPPDEYDQYVNAIRAEYAWLNDAEFAAGRSRVLKALSAMDPIYVLSGVNTALEDQARTNLANELARWIQVDEQRG